MTQNSTFHLEQNPEGILVLTCGEHDFSVDDVKSIQSYREQHYGSKKCCLLIVTHPFSSIENEARAHLAKGITDQNYFAKAYVIHSIAQKLLANFHTLIHPASIPTRFFSNQNEAIKWLLTFLKH